VLATIREKEEHVTIPTENARRRRAAGAVAAVAILLVACTHPRTSSTTTTASDFDVDTGPCLCRLPQDELSTCCRSSLVLTCRCQGTSTYTCQLVPTGRSCGGPSRASGDEPALEADDDQR
jgi:hypothetical protein